MVSGLSIGLTNVKIAVFKYINSVFVEIYLFKTVVVGGVDGSVVNYVNTQRCSLISSPSHVGCSDQMGAMIS